MVRVHKRWPAKVASSGLVLILAGGLLAAGCAKKPDALPTAAQAQTRGVPVTLQTVKRGDIQNNITLSGKISAGAEIKVVSKMSGKVARVLVELGNRVQAGQPLVALDSTDLEWKLKDAEVELRSIGPQIEQQQANLKKLESKLALEKANLDRQKRLFEAGAVTKQALETQENAYEAANADLRFTEQQIVILQATLERKRIAIDTLKSQISDLTVTAPVAGLVAVKHVEAGEAASPSAPVVTLVDTGKMYMDANLSEKEINLVSTGQKVNIVVDALGEGYTVEGVVANISPSADAKSRTFPVRFLIQNSDGKLKAGMFGKVALITGQKAKALLVPKEAVVERNGEKVVFTVNEGKAVQKKVVIGLMDEKMLEIAEGLSEGDQIVASGQQNLQDGSAVSVQGGGKPQGDKPADKPGDKATDKPADKPTDKPADKSGQSKGSDQTKGKE